MLWLKALHVMAVIAWFAGLFYLPRLFVYHAEATPGSETSETFKTMERRLLRIIMNPAMIVVWITGPWLAWWEGVYMDGWLMAKVVLVVRPHLLPPPPRTVAQGLPGGPQSTHAEILPDRERGADVADGRHRYSGGRKALLRRIPA